MAGADSELTVDTGQYPGKENTVDPHAFVPERLSIHMGTHTGSDLLIPAGMMVSDLVHTHAA